MGKKKKLGKIQNFWNAQIIPFETNGVILTSMLYSFKVLNNKYKVCAHIQFGLNNTA